MVKETGQGDVEGKGQEVATPPSISGCGTIVVMYNTLKTLATVRIHVYTYIIHAYIYTALCCVFSLPIKRQYVYIHMHTCGTAQIKDEERGRMCVKIVEQDTYVVPEEIE